MNKTIPQSDLTQVILDILEETFEKVNGIYLDAGTSLFETLETITAEEASRPVSDNCASISAHVEHMRISIETVMQYMQGEQPQTDWTEVWRTVQDVTPEEWANSQSALKATYDSLRTFISDLETWDGNLKLVLAIAMHNAYHLGEIRQALCTIKPNR